MGIRSLEQLGSVPGPSQIPSPGMLAAQILPTYSGELKLLRWELNLEGQKKDIACVVALEVVIEHQEKFIQCIKLYSIYHVRNHNTVETG